MRIVIKGKGRLGRSLYALLCDRAQVDLMGRGAPPTCDAVLLTVPDRNISEAAASIPPGPIVLHTSGVTSVDVLRPHRPAGSFHPLMTFPGPHALPDLSGVTAAIDGDPAAVDLATTLADWLGMATIRVPGDRRLYHAAAVLSGNFATVLLGEACRALEAAGVPRDRAAGVLAPLVLQSIRNAVPTPAAALTGPLARGDDATLKGHRSALEAAGMPDLAELHALLCAHATSRITTEDADPL